MKSYLSLIPISAKVHRRQNRMTLMCIAIAVFLVTTIFSMTGMFIKMEKANMIESHGYWHISLQNISEDVAAQINSRLDVKSLSVCSTINEKADENYFIGNQKAALYGIDYSWMTEVWDCLEEGSYPKSDTEVIVSPNAKNILGVKIGDSIAVDTPKGSTSYIISGFGSHDLEFNKLYDVITVYMDRTAFLQICKLNNIEKPPVYYIRFTTDRGITKRIHEIQNNYAVSNEAIDENTALLAITGYSSNEYARAFYPLAVVLFALILLAGVFMISSSMNSSVTQRTQFFGMMRCIGMSKQQVTGYVRLEALNWCKTAIPIGVILGIVSTWGLCLWLKYGIKGEFTKLPLFHVHIPGIMLGVVVGLLTVLIAAQSPAKRAAKVSPAAAVSGNAQSITKVRRTKLAGLIKIDTVLGINHAISARKNLILMTGSFALSIILFFGFSAGLDFAKALIPSTRSWQPDFSITSKDETNSVSKSLAAEMKEIEGVLNIYGNMVSLDVPVISEKDISEITLVSYEEYMLQCAKENEVSGDLSKLYEGNYVLTIYDAGNPLEAGDKVQVNGTELEVAGMVSEGLFEDDITLICTEETYQQLMGESDYALLNIQAADGIDKAQMVTSIRNLMNENYSLADNYDNNKANVTEYWAFRLVVYTFLAIIVLMAALNMINSTSMSVSARTKQYGAMRAVGMEGRQLTKMITAEVFTYAISGCFIGCILGLYLNKMIFEAFITAYFGETWRVPLPEMTSILLIIFVSAVIAVQVPAKRMRNMAVTETINEL